MLYYCILFKYPDRKVMDISTVIHPYGSEDELVSITIIYNPDLSKYFKHEDEYGEFYYKEIK